MRWTYHVGNTNANATLAGRGVIKEEVKLRVANGRDMSVMRSVMIFLVSNDGPREKHCHEKSGSAASQLVCQLYITYYINGRKH